ncbi:hypothetical protein [Rhizobium sp. RU36D]|uniref:hypothetical protein n=1 Tax=Rhizobium sp. RU36D TaxID=1907415 RepID=UPI0009D80779|nr:hypothetical protein [Rhizobium sp. RU36D]SMC80543.1 hypothetical protein SAMN05880593_10733 [Rhizobium sp. RU36D]
MVTIQSLWEWLGSLVSSATFASAALAAGTFFALIFGRYEIRLRRLRMIRDYVRAFPNTTGPDDQHGINPSFEFVRTKYSADVRSRDENFDQDRTSGVQTAAPNAPFIVIDEINETISKTRFFMNRGDWRLAAAAIPYVFVIFFGFKLVFTGPFCNFATDGCAQLYLNFLMVGGLPVASSEAASDVLRWTAQNTLTIAAITFTGAYVASLRYMVQALSIFDLSGYTMIRQTAMIVISVFVTVILYRALPDASVMSQAWTKPAAMTENSGVSFGWMVLALAFGLLPGSVFQFAVVKASNVINWVKQTDDRFVKWTRVVPLDVIDGIDYFTRFRLEECGISEVQSLATYNPIMLHIETPYGIYQAIDWIAQAQLCCVVGLDRFLMLRQFNIRTIFDLERALKQNKTQDEAAKAATDHFDRIYAAVLFAPNSMLVGIQKAGEAKFLVPDEGGKIKQVDAAEFSIWALNSIGASNQSASLAIEHLMDWIGDDLHVRRLRRLWNEISVRLGPQSVGLLNDQEIAQGKT